VSPRKPTSDEIFGPGGLIINPGALVDSYESSMYEESDNKPIRLDQPLQSALNRYPGVWIDGLCVSLGLSDKGGKKLKIQALVAMLTSHDMLQGVVASLPNEGREALSKVLQEGGWIKYSSLSRELGSEEQDSYFWNERTPVSVIGKLRVRGLLMVGRHDLGGKRYKVAVIPQELREPLKVILSESREE